MSKRMTRVLSLILTLVMFVSVSTPAFAWGGGDMGGGWDREIGEGDFRDFTPAEEVEEEKEEYDYFQTDGAEGFQVTVEAPMGSLPTLAELRAEPVVIEDVREAVESVMEGEANILVAMDISFWMNGVEIEPEEAVRVKISAPELTGKTNLTVVHIPDAEEPETVDLLDEGELSFALGANEVAFRADSFSVYAVVDDGSTGDNARLTVNFYGIDQDEGAEPVATVYVKNGDVLLGDGTRVNTASYIEDIVFDPGVGGVLPDSQLFLGWSIDKADANTDTDYDTANFGKNYSVETKPYTIGEIRSYLGGLTENNAIKEGDVLNIYAMIVKVFTVTYEHKGVVVASYDVFCLRTENDAPYTITENFTAVDDTHHFEGWNVIEGQSNILNPSPATAPYPQNTTMRLKGDVRFSTEVSEGHWLVFEENAYGATYNAPVFVKTGETAAQKRPELSQPANMKCSGYSFVDWYVLKTGKSLDQVTKNGDYYVIDDDNFEPFTWDQELGDKVFLYAKWDVSAQTKYTVIVWKQAVADDKDLADADKTYDYAFSVEVTDAQSLAAISSLDLSAYQNKDGQTITVGDKDYSFVGFKYNTTKGVVTKNTVKNSDNVDAVNPNGTTVVNLYYDRELVTYNFLIDSTVVTYTKSNSTSTGWYYIPLGNDEYEHVYLYRYNGTWYRDRSGLGIPIISPYSYSNPYYGDVYVRNSSSGWHIWKTYTGLYGQKITDYPGYTWPTEYRWFVDESFTTFMSIVDMFEQSANDNPPAPFVTDFYGESVDFNAYVYHYLQKVDGSYSEQPDYTIPCQATSSMKNGMVFRSFQGFEPSVFRIKLPNGVTTYQTGTAYNNETLVDPVTHPVDAEGWTEWLPDGTGVEYYGNTRHELHRWNATQGGIEFRYTRNTENLTYMVGRFVNKDQETMTQPFSGQLRQEAGIPYNASMAEYAKDGAKYYDPDTVDATKVVDFVFVGWYIDETCTTEAKFDGNMPDGGMTVYGKWQQKEYRVFLHPNAGTDPTLDWGSESQQMNFKVANGSKISLPTGTRTGYEFLGWYTDEAMTTSYSIDSRLNDTTVPATPAYDKTAQMTENADGSDMDKWGNLKPGAVNKDVNRPWVQRKLDLYAKWSQVLPGAEGIGVIYDPNGGSPAPSDTKLYKDNVNSVAQPAPSTPAPDRVDTAGVSHPQKFLYWVMQKWDVSQGKYVDLLGEQYHKYPGETFAVLKDNSRVEDLGLDTQGNQKYRYTIQLRAEWGDVDAPTPTHIDWYSNLRDIAANPMTLNSFTHTGSTSSVEGKGWVVKDEGKQINEAIEIRPATTYSYPGFKFLGWAKSADATANDLFLKWVVDHYEAKDPGGNWVPVTEVAADETQPYDDLYAIWEAEYFYIYHTSNKTVEKISAATLVNGKYDLAAKVASGTLYGGYYTEYGGVGADFDPTKLTGDGPFEDANGTAYTLDQVANSSSLWNLEKVCTENGHAMTPKADTVYYLKEVPDAYLKPYTQYTYYELKAKENMLGTVWCILGTDDLNYDSYGFTLSRDEDNGQELAVMGESLKFWPESNPGLAQELTCAKVYGTKYQVKAGFLGYAELNGFAADANGVFSGTVVIRQFWVTKDGVTVYGTTQRALSFGDGKWTSLSASDTTPTEP